MAGSSTSTKPKLTLTQAKVVKAKIKGELEDKTLSEIAPSVFPNATPESARVMMSRELQKVTVQDALEQAFTQLGLTPVTLVATVANGIGAHKFAQVKGDFIETKVPDHSIRLKAAGMAAQWMGIGKGEGGGVNVNFINVSKGDQGEYGL